MSIGLLFWLLMVLWLFLGLYPAPAGSERHWSAAGTLLQFALFFLLGWGMFGFVIHR